LAVTSGLEYIGATMSAPAPPPVDPPSNGGSRALSGVPPPIFNGDRDKSELFLDKFTSYEIVNGDAKQFTTPFLKVALCLSYMNGPKVDSWACYQRIWLKDQKAAGVTLLLAFKGQTLAKRVRLLGKPTGSYGKPAMTRCH